MSSSLVLSLGDLGELRGTNHPEHGQVWSIRDFINMVKEKPYGSKYGVSTWLAMLDGEYGSQGRAAPCTDVQGLQRILGVLPGKVAAKYRAALHALFRRYVAGDMSMVKELVANAESGGAAQALMRDALRRETGAPVDTDTGSARALEEEREERRKRMKLMDAEYAEKMANFTKTMHELMTITSVGGVLDDRDRLFFKDRTKNLTSMVLSEPSDNNCQVNNNQQLALTNGDKENTRSLTISAFAQELGLRVSASDCNRVGRVMARLYRAKYGTDPSKHEQFVDGAVRHVNSYTRAHEPLMREALREVGFSV